MNAYGHTRSRDAYGLVLLLRQATRLLTLVLRPAKDLPRLHAHDEGGHSNESCARNDPVLRPPAPGDSLRKSREHRAEELAILMRYL